MLFCIAFLIVILLSLQKQSNALLSWWDTEPLASGSIYFFYMGKRYIFYIDGFNFYYGLHRSKKFESKWQRAYWIDMVKLCKQFIGPEDIIEKVIYFTASPLNPAKSRRQSAFLNANRAINGDKFEIVRGKYLEKQFTCPYCNANISRPEEKRTDVNIAVRLIGDAALNRADVYALVSADSDLVTPLIYIKDNFPGAQIKAYFPPSNYCHDISDTMAHFRAKPILMKKSFYFFDRAHMPDDVTVGDETYSCPDSWK